MLAALTEPTIVLVHALSMNKVVVVGEAEVAVEHHLEVFVAVLRIEPCRVDVGGWR